MKETAESDIIYIYTDGACSGNPGPGGWAAVLKYGTHVKEISGGEAETTNNRMELTAAIKGIAAVKQKVPIHLYTDSTYLRDGVSSWLRKWQTNGWKTSQNKAVKNQDLWQLLSDTCQNHDVQWHWVRAHAGHPENERADFLARHAIVKEVMTRAIKP
jgi:ribonuclease HI